jgi:hypothetical protein
MMTEQEIHWAIEEAHPGLPGEYRIDSVSETVVTFIGKDFTGWITSLLSDDDDLWHGDWMYHTEKHVEVVFSVQDKGVYVSAIVNGKMMRLTGQPEPHMTPEQYSISVVKKWLGDAKLPILVLNEKIGQFVPEFYYTERSK